MAVTSSNSDMQEEIEALFGHVPIEINEHGGKQSKVGARFDLISPAAILRLAQVLDYGARRYGESNWKSITVNEHLNHCLYHIYAHLGQDTSEDHMGHAMTRIMMALDISINGLVLPTTDLNITT